MSRNRRQANQLKTGDRFSVQLELQFNVAEVVEANGDPNVVNLLVTPVPCGENCQQGCDCHYSMFADSDSPYPLRLDAKQRLPFLGNLDHLLAQSKLITAQIARLQQSGNGQTDGTADTPELIEVSDDGPSQPER